MLVDRYKYVSALSHPKKYLDHRLSDFYMQPLKYQFGLILTLVAFCWVMSAEQALAAHGQGSNTGHADPSEKQTKASFRIESEVAVGNSYRRDELDWNIAGNINGNNPNILSELTWEDLEIYQLKFLYAGVFPGIFYLRGYVGCGWIFDGKNQDSDYLGDNRTLEFSRSNNSSDDGDVLDASLGIGYPFRFGKGLTADIRPVVGYSYHEQNLTITDGYQTIATPGITPPEGPFGGLDSTYETQWYGPWMGMDLRFTSTNLKPVIYGIEALLNFEYHWADVEAEADWNLRTDFAHPKSFAHEADGEGIIISSGVNLYFTSNLALNFGYNYQDWSTDEGVDTVFFADGATVKTQLNELNWKSHAIEIGILYKF